MQIRTTRQAEQIRAGIVAARNILSPSTPEERQAAGEVEFDSYLAMKAFDKAAVRFMDSEARRAERFLDEWDGTIA